METIKLKKVENTTVYKKMKLCGTNEDKIYKCDVFKIYIDNKIVNAIAFCDDSYYFNIENIYKCNRNVIGTIYRSPRYFMKYIPLVRDMIFDYYKNNGLVKWLKK